MGLRKTDTLEAGLRHMGSKGILQKQLRELGKGAGRPPQAAFPLLSPGTLAGGLANSPLVSGLPLQKDSNLQKREPQMKRNK